MPRGLRIVVAGSFVATLLGAAAAFYAADRYQRAGPLPAAASVVVPKGADLPQIARLLKAANVVSDPLIFRFGARLEGADNSLKAGEYRFPPGVSMQQALAMLRRGETVVRRVTIPEGMTSGQVVSLLREAEGLEGEIAAVPVEGALLPETYSYSWGDSRSEMIRRMSTAMAATLDELWTTRAEGLPLADAARRHYSRLDRRERDRRAGRTAARRRGVPQPVAARHEAAGRSDRHLRGSWQGRAATAADLSGSAAPIAL